MKHLRPLTTSFSAPFQRPWEPSAEYASRCTGYGARVRRSVCVACHANAAQCLPEGGGPLAAAASPAPAPAAAGTACAFHPLPQGAPALPGSMRCTLPALIQRCAVLPYPERSDDFTAGVCAQPLEQGWVSCQTPEGYCHMHILLYRLVCAGCQQGCPFTL